MEIRQKKTTVLVYRPNPIWFYDTQYLLLYTFVGIVGHIKIFVFLPP